MMLWICDECRLVEKTLCCTAWSVLPFMRLEVLAFRLLSSSLMIRLESEIVLSPGSPEEVSPEEVSADAAAVSSLWGSSTLQSENRKMAWMRKIRAFTVDLIGFSISDGY